MKLNHIYHGHVLDVLKSFPDESVDCIVTSPPYWQLRDYGEETNIKWLDGWYGQLGLEPTLDLYLEHMLQITAELNWFDLDAVRVKHEYKDKDNLNLVGRKCKTDGDKYADSINWIGRKRADRYHILGKNPGDVWTIPTQAFPDAHFACTDKYTEILTKDGWKKWNEVTMNDEIATFNILDETIHYHKPYAIYKYDYDGELIVIENQWVAQYVTPNHRVLLKYIHSAKKRKPDEFWHYERAEKLRPYSGILIPLSGKYDGKLDIGSIERAELLGWIITEGSLSGLKKGRGITIYQSADVNPDKVKRIEELLQKCGIDYTRIDRKRQRSIIRGKEYIRHEVIFYIKKKGKNWQWILNWINTDKTPKWKLIHIRREQLEALYKAIIAGDGHIRKDERESFSQKDEYVREWFRTLCIHLGKRTTEFYNPRLRSVGTVFVTNKNYTQIHQSNFKECIKRIKYKGIVWCPHLPNTNFVARRKSKNGKYRYFITGNTFPEKLVEPMILAGCPQWICKKCGKARVRIIAREVKYQASNKPDLIYKKAKPRGNSRPISEFYKQALSTIRQTIGWTDCGCNAGWRSGVVLDPFMGSGTVAVVAKKLGRDYVGIEINEDYIKMAQKRLKKVMPNLFKPT